MGVDVGAFAGYGIMIRPDKDFKAETTRSVKPSCMHPEREGNTFCPKCGKKVESIVEKTEVRSGLDDFVDWFHEGEHPKGLACEYVDAYNGVYFVGWGKSADWDAVKVEIEKVPTPDAIWDMIVEVLEPWPHLAQRNKFAFHVVKTAT